MSSEKCLLRLWRPNERNLEEVRSLTRLIRYDLHIGRSVAEEKRAAAAGANRGLAIDAVRDYFYRGEIARRDGRIP